VAKKKKGRAGNKGGGALNWESLFFGGEQPGREAASFSKKKKLFWWNFADGNTLRFAKPTKNRGTGGAVFNSPGPGADGGNKQK